MIMDIRIPSLDLTSIRNNPAQVSNFARRRGILIIPYNFEITYSPDHTPRQDINKQNSKISGDTQYYIFNNI